MATNMDKALYQAPLGIEDEMDDGPELEIEIVDPEKVSIDMDGVELVIHPIMLFIELVIELVYLGVWFVC